MPEYEQGTPGYRAGQSGTSTTLTMAEGQRILGIWAWANGADGNFAVTAAQGTTFLGDTVIVRTGSGREWNPQTRLINPTITFSSALDWMVEFIIMPS